MNYSSKVTPEILYERLLKFAEKCQILVSRLSRRIYNIEYGKQLIRSSSSPGANYIEVMEAESFKEFTHKLKICRKETKESVHWLRLIQNANQDDNTTRKEIEELTNEAHELIRIFTSSVITSERNRGIKK